MLINSQTVAAICNVKLCGILKSSDILQLVVVSNFVAIDRKAPRKDYLHRHNKVKEIIIAKEPKLADVLKNVQIIALTRGEYKRRVEIHEVQEKDDSTADGPYLSFVGDPYVEGKKVASSKPKAKKKKGTTKKRKRKAVEEEQIEEIEDISDDEDGWNLDMESEEYGYDNNDDIFEYDRPSRACDKPSGFYANEDASDDEMEDDEFPEDEPNDSIDDYYDDIVAQMKKNFVFDE